MSQEQNRDGAGGSSDNPIVIMDSPRKRLAPSRRTLTVSSPAHTVTNRPSMQCSHTQSFGGIKRRKKNGVSFELYSHATDKERLVTSVHSVAGHPLLNEAEVMDLTSESDSTGAMDEPQAADTPSPTAHTPSPIAHTPSPIAHTPSPTAHTPSPSAHTPSVPFHKFSQGMLETMIDCGLGNADTLRGYLELTEQLLAHGYHIPAKRLPQLISAVLEVSDCQSLHKIDSLLCQDLHLRPSTDDLPLDQLQDILYTVTHTLRHMPTHKSSQVVLCYIAGLMESAQHPTLPSSLINRLLDMACSCVGVPGLLAITQTALGMSFRHSSHTFAGELSTSINQLPTKELKCAMLQAIPSAHCRLEVIDHHLTQYFRGPTATGLDYTAHLQRVPYEHNGAPLDLSYLLSLQLMLLETGLNSNCTSMDNVREGVRSLLGQLQEDPLLVDDLPRVWNQLQLLHALT